MCILRLVILTILFWAAPAAASEPIHDPLPSELVQMRDQGQLTVRALWAWQLVPEQAGGLALEFKDFGLDLLSADATQLKDWLARDTAGWLRFSTEQRELLAALLFRMEAGQEPQTVPDQEEQDLNLPVFGTSGGAPQKTGTALYRGNLARTGVFDESVPHKTPGLVWKLQLTEASCRTPVIFGDSGYIGSVDGHLYAIDLAAGLLRWKFYAEDWVEHPPAVSGELIYFGNVMGDRGGERHLFALNRATGQEVWRVLSRHYSINSSPAIMDGTVYFGSGHTLCAVDAGTGIEKWSFNAGESVGTPAISGETVFFSYGYHLGAIEIGAAEPLWTFAAETNITTCPVVAGDTVIFGATDAFCVYAVDRQTGKKKWQFKTGLILYPPVVHNGVVYASSNNGLHAFDAETGAEKWTISTLKWLKAPLVAENTLLVAADSFLLALDPDSGQEKWRFEADGEIGSPVLSGGTVYFWSNDGYFYAVR